MGAFSVPEEIRKMKPKGTMVKKIGNEKYYVYDYKTSKVKVAEEDGSFRWKTKTIMGKCIGTITLENGFVSNKSNLASAQITVKNYGNYAFVVEKAKKVFRLLKKHFNIADAEQIFCVATILFLDGFTYMKNMKRVFDLSYLSAIFPDVKLGYKALYTLYRNLGSKQESVRKFEQENIDGSSKRIAIDGHVIACASSRNDLSEFGYKASKLGMPQVNWITAYDVIQKRPLLGQIYSGSDPDSISVQTLFDRYQFSNTQFLVDRGFNTDTVKKRMSERGNTYIAPMLSNRKDYKHVVESLHFDKRRYFVYNRKRHASMVYHQEIRQGSIRYLAYKDTTVASMERQEYIRTMNAGKPGYTNDGLIKEELFFGLFLLETNNLELMPEEIYCQYKERWAIETYYNYVRNDLEFNAIFQQDYFCMQGLSFLMTVSSLIYNEIRRATEHAKISVKDILNEIKKIKMVQDGKTWNIRNNTRGVRDLCKKLDFEIPSHVDASARKVLFTT